MPDVLSLNFISTPVALVGDFIVKALSSAFAVIAPTETKFLLLKLISELPELMERVLPPSLVMLPLKTDVPCE